MRNRQGTCIAMCAALSLLSLPRARADCTMARVSQLPVQVVQDHPLVTATLNGGAARLAFDTGSFTSVLSEAAVGRLQLRRMQGEEIRNSLGVVSGVGGARSARYVTAHTVELGGLRGRDYNFIASDMGIGFADGLLSVDLVSQFDIDLDFPQAKIVLYRPVGDCSAPAAFLAGPLFSAPLEPTGVDRRPRVKVEIAGRVFTALVDTGAPRSAILRSAAERLGIGTPQAGSAQASVGGIGPGRVTATRGVVSDLAVGDLMFDRMPVMVLDGALGDSVQVILGADFQSRVHVWISYSSHTLIMQYPPKASKSVGPE